MRKASYIRSSKLSLKFCNKIKLESLQEFVLEYEASVRTFVEMLWFGRFQFGNYILDIQNQQYDCPMFCPELKLESELTARVLKCAKTQALGIVKSVLNKRKKDESKLEFLKTKGITNKKLELVLQTLPTKPEIKNISCEINSLLISVEKSKTSEFDYWLNLHSLYTKKRGKHLQIPLKSHRQMKKLEEKGSLLNSVLLSKSEVQLRFSIQIPEKINNKTTIAVDQGITSLITTSRNDQLPIYQSGKWTMSTIVTEMSKKKKGSKSFRKLVELRKNYINFVINRLNLDEVGEIKLEKIENIRYGRSVGRKMTHFSNPLIRDKFEKLCEETGVLLTHVDNQFNSQRCNKCGWTQKKNRQRKSFKCLNCSHSADADENASQNILIRDSLFIIPFGFRQKKYNLIGFYWTCLGLFSCDWLELTVPTLIKT